MKKKIKLNIIEDYIKLYQLKLYADNFLDADDSVPFKENVSKLKDVYEIVIFKLGLMDDSYLLLRKELSEIKPKSVKYSVEYNDIFKELFSRFNNSLKKCKFNTIEINFLLKDLKEIL